jgi:hypothetical protein
LSHARRIYGLLADAAISAAAELAERIRKKELLDGFTLRDVYRNCWHLLDTPERAQGAIFELIDAGWLREKMNTSLGKTRSAYITNPKIFS